MTPDLTGQAILSSTKVPLNQLLTLTEITDNTVHLKLLEMGCTIGTQLEKVKTALGKGPIAIKVHPVGTLLALRYKEASQIWVK